MIAIKPQARVLQEALEKPKEHSERVLLTILEVAEYLRVSKWTVYRLFDEKKLKSVRVRGRRLIRRADVERYIESQLAEGAA